MRLQISFVLCLYKSHNVTNMYVFLRLKGNYNPTVGYILQNTGCT